MKQYFYKKDGQSPERLTNINNDVEFWNNILHNLLPNRHFGDNYSHETSSEFVGEEDFVGEGIYSNETKECLVAKGDDRFSYDNWTMYSEEIKTTYKEEFENA
jgi:hypothetical protein